MSCAKNVLLTDLLGSQYLFEILQTSLTIKNSENGVKSGCFKKLLRRKRQYFSEMTEGYSSFV